MSSKPSIQHVSQHIFFRLLLREGRIYVMSFWWKSNVLNLYCVFEVAFIGFLWSLCSNELQARWWQRKTFEKIAATIFPSPTARNITVHSVIKGKWCMHWQLGLNMDVCCDLSWQRWSYSLPSSCLRMMCSHWKGLIRMKWSDGRW